MYLSSFAKAVGIGAPAVGLGGMFKLIVLIAHSSLAL